MMDRFTWGAVIGVVILCGIAMLSTLAPRRDQRPPDLSTPDGVVTAYVAAVRDKRPDDAWALLDSPSAIEAPGPRTPGSSGSTQDAFRLQVNNYTSNRERRVRIADVSQSGDTARVNVEVTDLSGDLPLFGPSSYTTTATFDLRRQGDTWRITSSPPIYQIA